MDINTLHSKIILKIDECLECEDGQALKKIYEFVSSCQIKSKAFKSSIETSYMNDFFCNNVIYYHPTSQLFFLYENKEYKLCTEDEVTYSILKFISDKKVIKSEWKHPIKSKIIKKIKESNHINKNCPDSETIQSVLNFMVPNIFKTRSEAKYFLTIIGDILTRKNTNIFFINSSLKRFLMEINKIINLYFIVSNISPFFKMKYHDQDKQKCRILHNNEFNMEYLSLSAAFYVNLICVSLHYSDRFCNSDSYLACDDVDEDIITRILFLKNSNESDVLSKFVDTYITKSTKDASVSENEICFLWKHYCNKETHGISIYHKYDMFLNKMKEKLSYSSEQKGFVGITNCHIPQIKGFIEFWKSNFYYDEDEYFLEVSEVLSLFRNTKKQTKINEQDAVDLLTMYDSQIKIIDNKYIQCYSCVLWNKKKDIDLTLKSLNIQSITEGLNIHKIYLDYCQKKNDKKERKVSKKYFETFIEQEL
jgi:hypothetical protein